MCSHCRSRLAGDSAGSGTNKKNCTFGCCFCVWGLKTEKFSGFAFVARELAPAGLRSRPNPIKSGVPDELHWPENLASAAQPSGSKLPRHRLCVHTVGAGLLAIALGQAPTKKTAPYGAVRLSQSHQFTYAPPPTISAVRRSSRSRLSASRFPVSVSERPVGRTSIARRARGSFSGRRWLGLSSVPGGT